MEIVRKLKVPTGHICIGIGERGKPLEFLSLGDYGKEKNIKADFMGLTKEINGVAHDELLPLSEKWVVTISSQYGCSMNCKFCDVPKVGRGVNATWKDMVNQVKEAIALHPEINYTKRLNLHFARMGEPTFNEDVLNAAASLYSTFKVGMGWGFHPVVSTMMPRKNRFLKNFLASWLYTKRLAFNGEAGLQLSLNTTDENARQYMFSGNALSLQDISILMKEIIQDFPIIGRKIALNFALSNCPVDANRLRDLFNPEDFMCKITPIHQTTSCEENNIRTDGGYQHFTPYKEVEENLKDAGFDVIVFVPSLEEDLGLITCGNAILSGKLPSIKYVEENIG